MSAGTPDPSLADDSADPRVEFFDRAKCSFKWAEKNSQREFYCYIPIGHILGEFANACKAPTKDFSVFSAIQHTFKQPDGSERDPDFASVLIPKEVHSDSQKESLIFVWEVKKFPIKSWFPNATGGEDHIPSQAQQSLKSYLRQLNEQALFAFHQYLGDTIPVFLSQGNCFTFLLYDRPANWDTLEVKYAETLKSGPPSRQSAGKAQSEPGTSSSAVPKEQGTSIGSQGQEVPSGEQERADTSSGVLAPVTSPSQQEVPEAQEHVGSAAASAARHTARRPVGNASTDTDEQGPTQPAGEGSKENAGADAAAADPDDLPSLESTEEDSTEPLFEKGDVPIPRLIFSCEYILLPDGSGFTPQFLKALSTAMAFRGVTFKSSDHIFCLPDDQQLDDISTTQSLDAAQKAIDDFKAEQDARKNPQNQSCSATTSASAASSNLNYRNPRSAIIPPEDGKLWNLRYGRQIMYKPTPLQIARSEPVTRHQPAKKPEPKRVRKSSKKTTLDESQDAPIDDTHANTIAGPLNAHVNAVAGPSNARVALRRPPIKSGMQDAGSSKKRKLDQVQDEPVVPLTANEGAGPSKKRGAAPSGRPAKSAAQDATSSKKRKLKSSEDAPAADARVDDAVANPAVGSSDEEVTGRSAEASTGNAKKPGQASRKGKERAH